MAEDEKESSSLYNRFLAGVTQLSSRSKPTQSADTSETEKQDTNITEQEDKDQAQPQENPQEQVLEGGLACDQDDLAEDQPCTLAAVNDITPAEPPPTIGSLHLDNVRWYFQDEQAYVGVAKPKAEWLPFCCHDSRKLEERYQEYLALGGDDAAKACEDDAHVDVSSDDTPCVGLVSVRGGLYDVDVAEHKARTVYWEEEDKPVMRGTWFVQKDGLAEPIEESLADAVEHEHVSNAWQIFQDHKHAHMQAASSVPADKKPKEDKVKELHRLSLVKGQAAIWLSDGSVRYGNSMSLGRWSGTQIYRGYATLSRTQGSTNTADDQYCRCGKPRHLVLVLHGIGQAFQKDITMLTSVVRNMSQQYATAGEAGRNYKSGECHIEYLPVEWRTSLSLDGGTIDEITPPGVDIARGFLNNSALDVLYFSSPRYCQEIVDSVTDKLNAIYTEFTLRNPDFESSGGQVSLIAHSLGGVIAYSVLAGQAQAVELQDDSAEIKAEAARLTELRREIQALKLRKSRRNAGKLAREQRGQRRGLDLKLPEAVEEEGALIGDADDDETMDETHDSDDNTDNADSADDNGVSAGTSNVAEGDSQPSDGNQAPHDRCSTPVSDSKFEKLHNLPAIFTKLKFEVKQMFALGSPMALFLTLRGAKADPDSPLSGEHLLPNGTRVYNIFHSLDPLAYRLEPLIKPDSPATSFQVPYYALPERRMIQNAIDTVTRNVNPWIKTLSRGVATIAAWRAGTDSVAMSAITQVEEEEVFEDNASMPTTPVSKGSIQAARGQVFTMMETTPAPAAARQSSSDEPMIDLEVPDDRLDFVLDGGSVSDTAYLASLQYMSLLHSHTQYWYRWDVVNFINKALVHQLGIPYRNDADDLS